MEPVKHLFTVDEYEAMGTAGLFHPDQRLELIEGEVVEMAPIGPTHAGTVDRLTQLLVEAVARQAIVRVQGPVRLSDISEPQPDLSLLRRREQFYLDRHPQPRDILLAVEVSDTTLRFDRTTKVPLYARSGVTELWVVDVNAATVDVFTDPGPDGYASSRTLSRGDRIDLTALPGVTIEVSDFLG